MVISLILLPNGGNESDRIYQRIRNSGFQSPPAADPSSSWGWPYLNSRIVFQPINHYAPRMRVFSQTPRPRSTQFPRQGRTAAICNAFAIVVFMAGCFPEDRPQDFSRPTPASCGNGTCELDREDCTICPQDCPCCAIVNSNGRVPPGEDQRLAEGRADGRMVALESQSELTLALGREFIDVREIETDTPLPDFEIFGTVESPNGLGPEEQCTQSGNNNSAIEVMVSNDGLSWVIVGIWGKRTDGTIVNRFDIGCAELTSIRWIRLKAQSNARAHLDAIQAIPLGENDNDRVPTCFE